MAVVGKEDGRPLLMGWGGVMAVEVGKDDGRLLLMGWGGVIPVELGREAPKAPDSMEVGWGGVIAVELGREAPKPPELMEEDLGEAVPMSLDRDMGCCSCCTNFLFPPAEAFVRALTLMDAGKQR